MAETYMEKALRKIARQINAFDEASLMSLWEKYAAQVAHFEPTKRWEEAVVVFNIIQSTRLKNQLFNYNWARSRMPDEKETDVDLMALTAPGQSSRTKPPREEAPVPEAEETGGTEGRRKQRKGKVLTLTPKNKK